MTNHHYDQRAGVGPVRRIQLCRDTAALWLEHQANFSIQYYTEDFVQFVSGDRSRALRHNVELRVKADAVLAVQEEMMTA